MITFIQRAKDSGYSLKGAFYEFQWPAVLETQKAAKSRGATVKIVFDDIDNDKGPRKKTRRRLRKSGSKPSPSRVKTAH